MKFQVRLWEGGETLQETTCIETAKTVAMDAGIIPEPGCRDRYLLAAAMVERVEDDGLAKIVYSPLFPNPDFKNGIRGATN
jgi:hypothetical protein